MSFDSVDPPYSAAIQYDAGVSLSATKRASDTYNMNHRHRGKFILIINKTFDPSTGMNEIKGTDVDALNLYRVFTMLGFTVEPHENKRAIEMLKIMEKAGQEDHADSDCIAVAVLSHGDHGVLYGIDETITNEQLVEPIKKCLSLSGKPKLFFFQASKDDALESSINVVQKDTDSEEAREKEFIGRIPQEADFLFVHTTIPGSWLVQALCQVLEDQASKNLDFLRVMTRVNKKVVDNIKNHISELAKLKITVRTVYSNKTPSVVTQLTKDLFLLPKTLHNT